MPGKSINFNGGAGKAKTRDSAI
uniref:Uncharacterized protein n=1 Tax=Arundo donax TaxID=35708 RepID=A0A0A9GXZ6_ARUDO